MDGIVEQLDPLHIHETGVQENGAGKATRGRAKPMVGVYPGDAGGAQAAAGRLEVRPLSGVAIECVSLRLKSSVQLPPPRIGETYYLVSDAAYGITFYPDSHVVGIKSVTQPNTTFVPMSNVTFLTVKNG